MAKNKENKPKKSSSKKSHTHGNMHGELTSMDDKSNESRSSVTGYKEQMPNSHFNQMK